MNIICKLDGTTLDVNMTDFIQSSIPISAGNQTLMGQLITDYTAYKRVWTLKWHHLEETTYNALYAIWVAQFSGSVYKLFEVSYYGVSSMVYLSLNDKDVKRDGCWIMDVEATLTEVSAIS